MILITAPSGTPIDTDGPLMDLICSADDRTMNRAGCTIHLLR